MEILKRSYLDMFMKKIHEYNMKSATITEQEENKQIKMDMIYII